MLVIIMEVTGTVKVVLPVQTGEGANGAWRKQQIVIEYGDKYPRSVCVDVWGELMPENAESLVGSVVEVACNVESRENNGRYYTDVKAWKFKQL